MHGHRERQLQQAPPALPLKPVPNFQFGLPVAEDDLLQPGASLEGTLDQERSLQRPSLVDADLSSPRTCRSPGCIPGRRATRCRSGLPTRAARSTLPARPVPSLCPCRRKRRSRRCVGPSGSPGGRCSIRYRRRGRCRQPRCANRRAQSGIAGSPAQAPRHERPNGSRRRPAIPSPTARRSAGAGRRGPAHRSAPTGHFPRIPTRSRARIPRTAPDLRHVD